MDKYRIGRPLGEGTFGKVKFAVNTETNERVAIKILDKEKIQKQNMGEQIKKEIAVMKMVKQKMKVVMEKELVWPMVAVRKMLVMKLKMKNRYLDCKTMSKMSNKKIMRSKKLMMD